MVLGLGGGREKVLLASAADLGKCLITLKPKHLLHPASKGLPCFVQSWGSQPSAAGRCQSGGQVPIAEAHPKTWVNSEKLCSALWIDVNEVFEGGYIFLFLTAVYL